MARRVVLALMVALFALAPSAAYAETADQVAAAFRSSQVYQAKGLDLLDVASVTAELSGGDPPVYVAVLPASFASSAAQADSRATDIGKALGISDAVVLVITANKHLGAGMGSAAAGRGVDADTALADELATDRGGFTKDNVTAFVLSFNQRIAQQVSNGGEASGNGSGFGTGTGTSSSSGGSSGLWLLGGVLAAGGVGTALVVRSGRRRRDRLNDGLKAEVEQLYNRLANDVLTLDPKDNDVARQALADASERYNATGAALAGADTPPEFAAARRTAVEGLTAARTARTALGLDPGPEIPLAYDGGPQLTEDAQVQFGDQTYDGSPTYQPGRKHYFGGGTVNGQPVSRGWYSAPFWEPFLLGSILSGGFGHGGGFGMAAASGEPGETMPRTTSPDEVATGVAAAVAVAATGVAAAAATGAAEAVEAAEAAAGTGSRRYSATTSSGSVTARTWSTVTPGASSRSTRPSGSTSMTARSVMIRWMHARPV